MKMYYVNSFPDAAGDYKIHEGGCPKLADFLSREFLNVSTSSEAAIKKAQKQYPGAKPCYCCAEGFFSLRKIINGAFLSHLFAMIVLVFLILFGYFL